MTSSIDRYKDLRPTFRSSVGFSQRRCVHKHTRLIRLNKRLSLWAAALHGGNSSPTGYFSDCLYLYWREAVLATHMGLPVKKRAQERPKQSKKSVLGVVSGVHIVTWFDTAHTDAQPGGAVSSMRDN